MPAVHVHPMLSIPSSPPDRITPHTRKIIVHGKLKLPPLPCLSHSLSNSPTVNSANSGLRSRKRPLDANLPLVGELGTTLSDISDLTTNKKGTSTLEYQPQPPYNPYNPNFDHSPLDRHPIITQSLSAPSIHSNNIQPLKTNKTATCPSSIPKTSHISGPQTTPTYPPTYLLPYFILPMCLPPHKQPHSKKNMPMTRSTFTKS